MSIIQITPQDAFALLQNSQTSVLIDVRTFEEVKFVGFVDDSMIKNQSLMLPWQLFPDMTLNPKFTSDLQKALLKTFAQNASEAEIIFMCRSGVRSNQAANYVYDLGYKNCYNMISGFEGDLDNKNQRAKLNGWKAVNLPWRQL